MQCSSDSGTIVVAEFADGFDHHIDCCIVYFPHSQFDLTWRESSQGASAQIEHNLDQIGAVRLRSDRLGDRIRKNPKEIIELGRVGLGDVVSSLDINGSQDGPT